MLRLPALASPDGLKAAAVVAAAAMALGVAAPLAEATEARNSGLTATQPVFKAYAADTADTSELAFTAADVRDLIQRIKADGGADTAEIAQFEAYANSLEGKAAAKPKQGVSTADPRSRVSERNHV
ncbi:hypothetical protein [Streptomyces lutosisoli]|uniref:Uncharacterized protein n=1 Tax=Streptomyces lutosisoli TaxID=2665721 RepID=A0ABW2VDK0_9ACTN